MFLYTASSYMCICLLDPNGHLFCKPFPLSVLKGVSSFMDRPVKPNGFVTVGGEERFMFGFPNNWDDILVFTGGGGPAQSRPQLSQSTL